MGVRSAASVYFVRTLPRTIGTICRIGKIGRAKGRTDRGINWTHENSGYDLYDSRSAAAQLGISLSYSTMLSGTTRRRP